MADPKMAIVIAPKKADASTPTPTPAEKAAMQKQMEEAKQDAANQAGAKAAAGPNRLMKKGGKVKKMASGGETMGPRTMAKDVEAGSNKLTKFGESAVQKRGKTKGKNLGDSGRSVGIEKMARGGGIESRGKTRGKYC